MSLFALNLFDRKTWTNVTKRTLIKRVVNISGDIGASPLDTVSWLNIDACWWTDLHQITLKWSIGICITPNIPINEEFLAVFSKSLLNSFEEPLRSKKTLTYPI